MDLVEVNQSGAIKNSTASSESSAEVSFHLHVSSVFKYSDFSLNFFFQSSVEKTATGIIESASRSQKSVAESVEKKVDGNVQSSLVQKAEKSVAESVKKEVSETSSANLSESVQKSSVSSVVSSSSVKSSSSKISSSSTSISSSIKIGSSFESESIGF